MQDLDPVTGVALLVQLGRWIEAFQNAVAMHRQSRLDEARRLYQKALDLEPHDAMANFIQGQAFLCLVMSEMSQDRAAADSFQKVLAGY